MSDKFRSRKPYYPDDSDYTTNAPSYYDDLARKNKLIELLSKRIWEYDEELAKRFDAWDKNLEEFDDEVLRLLQEWMADGTFDHIINEEIFSWKADQTDLDETNKQLTETTQKTAGIVNIDSFSRLEGETDDTGRLQRAIDSFEGNIAGTLVIPYDIRISAQVTCNKTGLRLVGVSNRKSRIICTHGGIGLFIKPLYNGNPYTSVSYCKFYADNIAIVAEGDATVSGTGLWLQWIFACSFINLYTSGFAKHIVLKGAHLNTFYNLYQGNKDTTERTLEIHNRGVGLSADSERDETGETHSNNNSIIGGWINNTSWDLRGLRLTTIQGVNFEPQSNTLYLGSRNTLRNCRLERFDHYAPNLYNYFPWIVMDNSNLIEHCTYHNGGPNNLPNRNPVLTINGNDNEIRLKKNQYSFNYGFIRINEQAEHNLIYDKSVFIDNKINPGYYSDFGFITSYNSNNTLITTDPHSGNEVTINTDRSIGKGMFTNYVVKNKTLVGNSYYIVQDGNLSGIDIPLPTGRQTDEPFAKFTLTSSSGNRRVLSNTNFALNITKKGVYTLNMMVFIPNQTNGKVFVRPNITYPRKELFVKDKWVNVQLRCYLEAGVSVTPTIELLGVTGESVYFGEVSLCEGNNGIYIENDTFKKKTVLI